MIKPVDIENKKFSRAKKGFDTDEVDAFLDQIAIDLEKLYTENRRLNVEINRLQTMLDDQANTDESVVETLKAAKALMNDIAASAEKRAEIIIANAEVEAKMITRDAEESISRLKDDGRRLKRKIDSLKSRYRGVLESELQKLDTIGEDILEDLQKDFIPASMEGVSETKVGIAGVQAAQEGEAELDGEGDSQCTEEGSLSQYSEVDGSRDHGENINKYRIERIRNTGIY